MASAFGLEFGLDQQGEPRKREGDFPSDIESEVTIEHTIHVAATAKLTGNDEEPYEDLQIGDDAWYRSTEDPKCEVDRP